MPSLGCSLGCSGINFMYQLYCISPYELFSAALPRLWWHQGCWRISLFCICLGCLLFMICSLYGCDKSCAIEETSGGHFLSNIERWNLEGVEWWRIEKSSYTVCINFSLKFFCVLLGPVAGLPVVVCVQGECRAVMTQIQTFTETVDEAFGYFCRYCMALRWNFKQSRFTGLAWKFLFVVQHPTWMDVPFGSWMICVVLGWSGLYVAKRKLLCCEAEGRKLFNCEDDRWYSRRKSCHSVNQGTGFTSWSFLKCISRSWQFYILQWFSIDSQTKAFQYGCIDEM